MRKVNLTGGKALKLIVGMVCLCIIIGMLAANSLKVLSIANYGNARPVISSGNSGNSNNGGSGNSGNSGNFGNSGSSGNSGNSGSANSGSSNSGVGTTSGALPSTTAPSTTTDADNGSSSGGSSSSTPTEAPTEKTDEPTNAPTQAPAQTTKPTEPATDSPEVKKEKALILGEYKTIVNASNSLAHGFTKSQYRTLDKTNTASFILASRFESKCPDYIISKDSPKVTAVAAGNIKNMVDFCIPYQEAACYADTSKASEMLKSATKTTDEDGIVTITLVLRDEVNPIVKDEESGKPASYTSSIFDIIAKEDFTTMANKASLFGSTTNIDMTYSECTVVLKYKPLTLSQKYEIVSLTQTVNYIANVSDGFIDGWNGVLGSFIPLSTGVTVTEVTEYSAFTTIIDEVLDELK